MEPGAAFAAIPHALKALKFIDKRAKEIAATTPDDANYYIGYIDIAKAAVQGLYDESIGILLQATCTSPDNPDELKALLARMNEYFYSERLRPKLKDALEHLGVGQGALAAHASAKLIYPSIRTRRQDAIQNYELLLSTLGRFLESLGDWNGRSGAALQELETVFPRSSKAIPTPKNMQKPFCSTSTEPSSPRSRAIALRQSSVFVWRFVNQVGEAAISCCMATRQGRDRPGALSRMFYSCSRSFHTVWTRSGH